MTLLPGIVLALASAAALACDGTPAGSRESLGDGEPPAMQTRLNRVDTYFAGAAEEDLFGGVVLVARGDEPILHRPYGLADHEARVPMALDHVFRLGSLTKPVTASAVLIAVERDLLELDQPVCELLPGCPRSWAAVTIAHALSHRSGIRDHFGDLEAVPVEDTHSELSRVLASLPGSEAIEFTPGEDYAYSNFNYVLLGAALEDVTGIPWNRVLDDWIFQPFDLESMGYDDVYAILPRRARGYGLDADGRIENIDYDDHAAYAAGGLRSTSDDFFRWSRAFLSGLLVQPDLVAEALKPRSESYGFGWQTREFFGRRVHNHTGGIDGFSTHLSYFPEDDLTVLVFANVEDDSAILRACDAGGLLFDWPTAMRQPTDTELTPRQRCGIDPAPS